MFKIKFHSFFLLILFFFFANQARTQVTINRVGFKFDSTAFDSVMVNYTSFLGKPKYLSNGVSNISPNCAYQSTDFVFQGALDTVSLVLDTTIRLGQFGFVTAKFDLRMVWDTSNISFPPSPWILMDSFGYDSCQITAIEEKVKELNINIYPNPARDQLFIDTPIPPNSIRLFNGSGKLMSNYQLNDRELDVSNLPNGIYIIQMDFNGILKNKKLIINKP